MKPVPFYQRLLSFFYPVTIRKFNSEYNPGLCIQMEAGKLLLNTRDSNYSYGNLHKVFDEVFDTIDLYEMAPQRILLAGLGAGSVPDILLNDYGLDAEITALEIDPAIVESLEYWDPFPPERLKIVMGDALTSMKELSGPFDLIVIDLFIGLEVHPSVRLPEFVQELHRLLEPQGTVLVNYIVQGAMQKQAFSDYQLLLFQYFNDITGHDVIGNNRVLEAKAPK